jgi:hydroxyacylglutathione hydrolase
MRVETVVVGEFQVNCHIIWGKSREAIVVDPGADPEAIAKALARQKLTAGVYLLTHGHMDHLCALADLFDTQPAPVAMHPDDRRWAFSEVNQMPPFYPVPRRPNAVGRDLADGQQWTDAGLSYRVIATPGHTPGSVCFYFEDEGALLTGDTLFAGSVGRTDLPGGDGATLTQSLARIRELPEAVQIYSGHGPETQVGREKKANYFLQGNSWRV